MGASLTAALAFLGACATPALAKGSGSNTATVNLAPIHRPTVLSVTPNVGPSSGGQEITVIGAGFVVGAKVEIGQGHGSGPTAVVASNVRVISATEITARTGGPAKVGTWNLFVITPAGTSASHAADHYTYVRLIP